MHIFINTVFFNALFMTTDWQYVFPFGAVSLLIARLGTVWPFTASPGDHDCGTDNSCRGALIVGSSCWMPDMEGVDRNWSSTSFSLLLLWVRDCWEILQLWTLASVQFIVVRAGVGYTGYTGSWHINLTCIKQSLQIKRCIQTDCILSH